MNKKYTKEILEPIVKKSYSIYDVMRNFGVKLTGGSHSHFSKIIKMYEINTEHFTGKFHNRGKLSNKRLSFDKILVERKDRPDSGIRVRRALIESGQVYMCEICKLLPLWNKKELRLQVDHIDRNRLDNRKENLRFLCPNCHSQTEGYSGSKGYTDLMNSNRYQREKRKIKKLATVS